MPKGQWNKGKGPKLKWLMEHAGYQGDDCLTWPFAVNKFWGRGTLSAYGKIYGSDG